MKYVLSGDPEVRAGYLRIVPNRDYMQDDVGVAFFYNFLLNNQLYDSTGAPYSQKGCRFVLPVEKTASVNTGFAWAPAHSAESFEVTATLYDSTGAVFQQKPLDFEGHLARFFTDIFDSVPTPFLGKMLLEAPDDFVLTVLRLELTGGSFQLTSVPPSPVTSGGQFAEQINRIETRESSSGNQGTVYSQLALGGGYDCIVIVSNLSESPWNGNAQLRQGINDPWSAPWTLTRNAQLATPNDSSFPIDLDPDETVKYVLGGDAAVRSGYISIDPEPGSETSDIAVSFFYNLEINQQLADSTGTPAGKPAREFVIPVEKSLAVNTGLAWASPDETFPFDITLRLFDQEGTLVEERIEKFSGHLAVFFTELFESIPDDFLGQLQIIAQRDLYLTILRLEFTPTGFQLTSSPPE
jgi:hypothetical protein